jgi:hypothetical protein
MCSCINGHKYHIHVYIVVINDYMFTLKYQIVIGPLHGANDVDIRNKNRWHQESSVSRSGRFNDPIHRF